MLSNALWSGASERESVEERISVAPEGALGLLVHVFYLILVMFVDNLTTQFERRSNLISFHAKRLANEGDTFDFLKGGQPCL